MSTILIGIGLLLFAMYNSQRDLQKELAEKSKGDFDHLYIKYGELRNLDPELIKAHAIVESNEDPQAKGPTKDYGLMQVVYPQSLPGVYNWKLASVDRLLNDVDYNVDVATQIMQYNHSQYSFKKAIAVYNSSQARKSGPDGPFPNQSYVDKVMNAYTSLLGVNYFGESKETTW